MIATRNSARVGTGRGVPRAARVAALGLGIALFASGCGGGGESSGNEGDGGGSSDPATSAAATSALACPEPDAGSEGEARETTDPSTVPASETTSPEPLRIGSILPTTGTLAFLGPPEIAGVDLAVN